MKFAPCTASILGVCLAFQWAAGEAFARDYWLEPSRPAAGKSEELVLHLQTGDHLKTEEEKPLQKDRIARFDLYGDQTARHDLLASGQENQLPAAKIRLGSGPALVVMDRRPRPITMEADHFNQYLADEGLDAVIAQRAHAGQTDAPGRESYARFLKTLVQESSPTAATANTLYKRRVGQRLEILLENDPDQLGSMGGELTVKVLFDGAPLTGAKVSACRRVADDQPPHVVTGTTSVKGLAKLKLDQPGLWLVRTVTMRAASPGAKPDAPQWESFWATYTFAARLSPATLPTAPSPK